MESFGALCVLNDDLVLPKGGVGAHPHRNCEMLWIVLKGELTHRDDLGNRVTLQAGDVQLLSAGIGVWHSEKNESDAETRVLQMWLTPDELDTAPRYEKRTLPTLFAGWQTIAAPLGEKHSNAVSWRQKAWLSRAKFEAGTNAEYQVRQSENGIYLFVLEGEIIVGDMVLKRRDALALWKSSLSFQALNNCDILLFDVPSIKPFTA